LAIALSRASGGATPAGGVGHRLPRPAGGLLGHEGIVHQRQRLGRHVGDGPPAHRLEGNRRVEGEQEPGKEVAADSDVQAPPPRAVEGPRLRPAAALLELRQIHLHRRAADGAVEAAGDGVELVVVAAGAAERESEKGLAERVDAVVDPVGLVLGDVHGGVDPFAEQPEAGAHDRAVGAGVRIEPRRVDEVAGDMFADELVVGEIVVEGLHDPVAIAPGVGDRVVELVAAGLGVEAASSRA